MPLISFKNTVRINLPEEGEWIDVKEKLSKGDLNKVEAATMQSAKADTDGNVSVDIATAMVAAEFALPEVAIVAWSFPEPVTPENIKLLDPESFDFLRAELDKMYPTALSRGEKRGSRNAGNSQSKKEPLSLKS